MMDAEERDNLHKNIDIRDARIAGLEAKLAEAQRQNVTTHQFVTMRERAEMAESQLTAANAAIDKARKALEPMASACDAYDRQGMANFYKLLPTGDNGHVLNVGDLRLARATLTELDARKDNG